MTCGYCWLIDPSIKIPGRPRTEDRLPLLEADISSLVDPQSQFDPKSQSAFAYTRMTAANVRQALAKHMNYKTRSLPGTRTLHRILNRLGYRLQRVLNTKPVKKIKETDAILGNVEFADQNRLEIELIYYPPYHSTCNPIERCWGVLEMHWNETLLGTVEKTIGWAKTMTWKRICPVVRLLDRVCGTKIQLTRAALRPHQQRLRRGETRPRWSVTIHPRPPRQVPIDAHGVSRPRCFRSDAIDAPRVGLDAQ